MGVYSTNRTQLGNYSADAIVANESYTHQTGLLEMVIDNAKNDQAIFEAVITNDFKEAAGIVQESTEAIQESVSGFIDKVKAFIKKCWEKVKAIFKSFMVKINNIIIRDNKEFVNKYAKEVRTKDLSKMKYKWAEPTKFVLEDNNTIDELKADALDKIGEIPELIAKAGSDNFKESLSNGDELDRLLGLAIGENTSAGEFSKDFHDKCFGSIDVEEGLDNRRLTLILNRLTNSADALKSIKNLETAMNKYYAAELNIVDKKINVSAKTSVGKGTDAEKEKAVSELSVQNTLYKYVQILQSVDQKFIGASMAETKILIAQCRRVFAQAAAFNPKSVKENAIFIEAVGDSAEYEVISSFEDYSL